MRRCPVQASRGLKWGRLHVLELAAGEVDFLKGGQIEYRLALLSWLTRLIARLLRYCLECPYGVGTI